MAMALGVALCSSALWAPGTLAPSPLLAASLPAVPAGLVAAQADTTSVFELEGLVISATPVPLPESALGTHVTVLDGELLRQRGMMRVLDALREVPGLSVARNGSFGALSSVFFRGSESDHALVLVDGVQVNQPGGLYDFSGLTTENVERIEIVRGPSSALYGSDAVAGVIHVVTRKGNGAPRTTLTSQAGSFGRRDVSLAVTGGTGQASYGLTLARYDTDGILEFNNTHRNTVMNGRVDVEIDETSQVRVSARALERSYGFPTDFSGNIVDTNQQTFFNEAQLGVEFTRRVTSALDIRALLTVFDSETGTDDAPDSAADTLGSFGFQSLDALTRTQADVRANWSVGPRTVLSGGFEYEKQDVRSFNESLSQWGPSTGRSAYDRTNRAFYGHVVSGVGALAVNGGVRFEDNEQFGRFTTWQLGVSWTVSEATRLRAAAGRGLKEPTFYEAFATGFVTGNPELQPERSTSWEVGVEQSLVGDRVALQATWFDQRLRDLIQYTGTPPVNGDPNYFNIAGARSRGLEFTTEARIIEPLRLSAEWSWFDTEVEDAGFDDGPTANFVEGEALLRRPDQQLRVALDWVGEGPVSGSISALRVGERTDRNFTAWPVEAVTLSAYTVVDASLEARVLTARAGRPGFTLFLRGENLFDADYVEVFGFQTPGRGVYVGGRVQIGR